MLISSNMKKLLFTIILLLAVLFPTRIYAANPQFSLRPGSGNVLVGKNFTVDILIDTKGNNVALARAVLKFDPSLVQVIKANRNQSLFCQYPDDQQSIDNDNGLVMVTGFCQSGVGQPYKTSGDADVLARVTFKAVKSGTVNLEWEYSGEDEPLKSVIMKDGSPPTNLLKAKPSNPRFVATRGTTGTPTTPTGPTTPVTGLGISAGLVTGGLILVLLGFGYSRWVDFKTKSKLRTIVDYGNSGKK